MHRRHLLVLGLVTALLGVVWTAPAPVAAQSTFVMVAQGRMPRPALVLPDGTRKLVPAVSAGTVAAASLAATPSDLDDPNVRSDNTTDPGGASAGVTVDTAGCGNRNTAGNVRVNQDCTFRRQAEEAIAVNPANPRNLVAGQNDSVAGFNH